jgi:sugar phosphate isomerase/epimerase
MENLYMSLSRRDMLTASAGTLAGLGMLTKAQAAVKDARHHGIRFGMCDWSLSNYSPGVFKLAEQVGLDGVQVSLGLRSNNLWLRRPEVRMQYQEAAVKSGVSICSLALGELNLVPLMSEPRAAIWLADSIEVAEKMNQRVILIPFFVKGELRADNETDMQRVIDVLRELAPRAEKAGVVLGLETYLPLKAHLRILDAVQSPALQVYYDFYNLCATKDNDFTEDLKTLGRERICEVHFKEGPDLLGSGALDWSRVVDALLAIDYKNWVVLETASPSNDVIADTRANLRFTKELFNRN